MLLKVCQLLLEVLQLNVLLTAGLLDLGIQVFLKVLKLTGGTFLFLRDSAFKLTFLHLVEVLSLGQLLLGLLASLLKISLKLLIFLRKFTLLRLSKLGQLRFIVLSSAQFRRLQLLHLVKELSFGMLEIVLQHLCLIKLVLSLVLG